MRIRMVRLGYIWQGFPTTFYILYSRLWVIIMCDWRYRFVCSTKRFRAINLFIFWERRARKIHDTLQRSKIVVRALWVGAFIHKCIICAWACVYACDWMDYKRYYFRFGFSISCIFNNKKSNKCTHTRTKTALRTGWTLKIIIPQENRRPNLS